eukprot:tig00021537_g22322.t1
MERAAARALGPPLDAEGATGIEAASDVKWSEHKPSESDLVELEAGEHHLGRVKPCDVSWTDVRVSITTGGFLKKKAAVSQVLHGVSGVVRAGELCAILGGSGSGKTTLLNYLSSRLPSTASGTGDVLVNGAPYSRSEMKRTVGYVLQDDYLLPYLNVRECLEFSALLRLPASMSRAEKLARADAVIGELGLRGCAGTKIGGPLVRGVSGGERRRVSIGVVLLQNPSVLYLDEPTSGLDATTALRTVECLHRLARAGRTVLATIHQPRYDVWALVDVAAVLSRGRQVYFGAAADLPAHFAAGGYPCPDFANPADFVLDVSSVDERTPEAEAASRARVEALVEHCAKSALVRRPAGPGERPAERAGAGAGAVEVREVGGGEERASWGAQFGVLYRRCNLHNLRDPVKFLACSLQVLVMSLLVGAFFFQLGNDQVGVRNRMGAYYITTSLGPYIILVPMITHYLLERGVVVRDLQNDMYDLSAYWWGRPSAAKQATDIPLDVAFSLCYAGVVYGLVGFRPGAAAFGAFFLLVSLAWLCTLSWGLLITAGVTNYQAASLAANTMFSFASFSAGYFYNRETISPAIRWMENVVYSKFALEGLLVNELSGREYPCPTEGPAPGVPPLCPYPRGEVALEFLGFQGSSVGRSAGVLVAMVVILRVAAFVWLRLLTRPK